MLVCRFICIFITVLIFHGLSDIYSAEPDTTMEELTIDENLCEEVPIVEIPVTDKAIIDYFNKITADFVTDAIVVARPIYYDNYEIDASMCNSVGVYNYRGYIEKDGVLTIYGNEYKGD